MAKKAVATAINNVSNDAADDVSFLEPYIARVAIVGTCPILFHRWSCDAIAEKSAAAKGSKSKKTDNVESYVYRDEKGVLCLPGEYLRQSVIHAAKFRQDPRSPRKSARDLFNAGVVALSDGPLGKEAWDYIDRRRVCVQRNGVTRERPAFREGWKATIELQVLTPEYISASVLSDVLTNAGRLVGVGDFRPTFGRFRVASFDIA